MKNIKTIAPLLSSLFLIPSFAFAAEGPCSNYAKFAAIRAYKAEVGTVQGSDGIEYSASLLEHQGSIYKYSVSISDNNEDGESWTVEYLVDVKREPTQSCKVISVATSEQDI